MSEKQSTTDVSSDDRLWAALAYVFSPLVPVILLLLEDKKDRPYIRAHNFQALVAGLLISFIIIPFTLGCGVVVWLVMFYWAYQAYQGEMVNIPLISDFVKNQGWA
ncbi:MAG: DUF4870 domain-containing protein [Chloroflexi bacterium]|nr:DUF4870 domain-containing protein [Chloroflexota bacterium]